MEIRGYRSLLPIKGFRIRPSEVHHFAQQRQESFKDLPDATLVRV